MLTVAYLANEFPSPVEPYVGEEIAELRRRGARIIPGSVRKPRNFSRADAPEIVICGASALTVVHACLMCLWGFPLLAPLFFRIMFGGKETPWQRLKALAHTFLGACYAAQLKRLAVDHIHVHHGYFGSWIGLTAARLLGVEFSMTLHGSDLLLHRAYLDFKLRSCSFCLTVSEFNRRYITESYPGIDSAKILVARLGVDAPNLLAPPPAKGNSSSLTLVAVGRLHSVKNHAFLVRACAHLRALDVAFECFIAGEGPERGRLESLIRSAGLEGRITLLGQVKREQMDSLYDRADVVALTSVSEGIPLVLMEAMARRRIVLAPAITGIPELVVRGRTGFLYQAGSMSDFVDRLLFIHSLLRARRGPALNRFDPYARSAARVLDWIRHGAQTQVRHNFNRARNLDSFAEMFLRRIAPRSASVADENLVLQQI
ncbi:MAG TPA: glycosyltransferase family 4 protein [Candidatus Sulfotelmatobacter sp.]|jgi:glycosyltransferase involved in cell wall biosynthesis